MITFKYLDWDNIFSYGEGNSLYLCTEPLVQITGENGNGKSTIALILQELLYGKNSKGIKKEDLFNRYLSKKPIRIACRFTDDTHDYEVSVTRGSTMKLKLLKDGHDISAHTATGTYKMIQEIIGYDFKTFVQVTSQSSTSGLDFLTATDTTRKTFLINLLVLDEYVEKHNKFKTLVKETTDNLNNIKGSVKTIEDWIRKHEEIDLTPMDPIDDIPDDPEEKIKTLALLERELKEADNINKNISKNEEYKKLLAKIPAEVLTKHVEEPEDSKEYDARIGEWRQTVRQYNAIKEKYESLGDICHTCKQKIDPELKENIITESINAIYEANKEMTILNEKIYELDQQREAYNKHKKLVKDFEDLMMLIDKDLKPEYVDKTKTLQQITELKKVIQNIEAERKKAINHNIKAKEHNTKIGIIESQLIEYDELLVGKEKEFQEVNKVLNRQEILRDLFSTKGLVAYKIEALIKELEKQINIYLAELSNGKFLINFLLSGDKLNIEIITDSISVAIESLSAGELSRVNVATLLAIRKLMSAISTNRLNILFLDEITAVLDDEGKEKLVEVLMNEDSLNTFIIAHDYSHPLIPRIDIVKENNISRIANG